MAERALVLFAHGARDPRWAVPFQRLQKIIETQTPGTRVQLAFLELMEPRLPSTVQQMVEAGCREITIVPVFFGQGGHVLRDLPVIVDQLRVQYPHITLNVATAVGEDDTVLKAIASYCIASMDGKAQ